MEPLVALPQELQDSCESVDVVGAAGARENLRKSSERARLRGVETWRPLMLHEWIPEEEFFAELTELDATISARVAKVRCPYCGGPLHRSYYERKPRGGLMGMAGEGFRVRHSLCCGR